MEPRFYDNFDEFYDTTFPFLVNHEAENNIHLSILNALKIKIDTYGKEYPLLFTIADDSIIKLVVLRTPPHDLLMSYTEDLNTVEILVEELIKRNEKLPGVLSFNAADLFAEQWCEKNSLKYDLFRKERAYRLTQVSEDTLGHRKFSVAHKDHQDLVFQWTKEMMREALTETTDAEVQRNVDALREEFNQDRSSIYLLFENDKPVSMARKAGKTPNGNFINLVFTPKTLRRRGYATECVAKLCKLILDEGNKYCFLFTDLSNPTSNSIYQKIGYQPVIDKNHYKFFE